MIQNYVLIEEIAEGSFGKVYKAYNTTKKGEFAVKMIPIEKFSQNPKLQQYADNEIRILSDIGDSEHIIKFYEVVKTKYYHYFVYQYCEGGTLKDMIQKQGTLSEKKALGIFGQLLSAFRILNKGNIIHRDLKPQNIMFQKGKVKLGDFGLCKELNPEDKMTKTMLGSPLYMAPEVLKGSPYTTKADIWSLGVILYEMVYGYCPYESKSIAMLVDTISRSKLEFPSSPQVSEKFKDLLRKMLSKQFYLRIGWFELFKFQLQETNEDNKNIKCELNRYSTPELPQSLAQDLKVKQMSPGQKFMKYKSQFKKSSSLPKDKPEDRKNMLLSQNYINLLSVNSKPKKIDHSFNMSLQTTITQKPDKRSKLLKLHKQCVEALVVARNIISKKGISFLKQIYFILKVVKSKLKDITMKVQVTELELSDIASLINFEIIQIDRQIAELKQQMSKLKIPVPLENESMDFDELTYFMRP